MSDDIFQLPYSLEHRPSTEFAYEIGKKKISDLPLASTAKVNADYITPDEGKGYEDCLNREDLEFTNRQGKLLKLSAKIDMENHSTIGCAGAVLTYIGRRNAVAHSSGDAHSNSSFRIATVQTFSLKDMM